jgi:3-hydroxyisobutyrate dehydrogenase
MRIGVAGLGRMGAAMAARLIEQGCGLAVWNRSAAALNHVAGLGAEPVATPADLWDRCDFVLSSLTDDQALAEVYLGPGGLLGARAGGKTAVDTSTVLPATVRRLAEKAAAVGCQFLDSPVLGTSTPARQGQLVAMVGGDASAFERALPLLKLLTRKARHLGPSGSGAAMKLSVNIPMTAYWAAFSESLALAAVNGLDVRDVIEIIQDSPAALAQMPLKREILMGNSTQVGFAIEGVVKNLQVIRAAAGTELSLPLVEASLLKYRAAIEIGAGAEDVASITHHHRALHHRVRPA